MCNRLTRKPSGLQSQLARGMDRRTKPASRQHRSTKCGAAVLPSLTFPAAYALSAIPLPWLPKFVREY
jgi:hypothetical protein